MPGRRARRRAAAQEKEKAGTEPSPAPATAAAAKLKPGKVTLREQSLLDRGIKSSLPPGKRAALVRIEHLEKVAAWASATIPPLGAFLGARLAATCETEGLPPSGATLSSTCQRCESFLHLGVNCSVEEEEDKRKKKRKATDGKGKPCAYLVYICDYCKHRNRRPAPGPKKRAELMRKALAGKAAAELTPAIAATPQSEERKERSSHERTGMLAGSPASAPVPAQAPAPTPTSDPSPVPALEVEREGNEVVSPAQTPSVGSIRVDNDEGSAAAAAELTSARPPAVASRFATSAPSPCTPTPSGSGKKRKRKGWTSLKDIASQSVEQAKAVRTPIFSMGNLMLRNLYSSS